MICPIDGHSASTRCSLSNTRNPPPTCNNPFLTEMKSASKSNECSFRPDVVHKGGSGRMQVPMCSAQPSTVDTGGRSIKGSGYSTSPPSRPCSSSLEAAIGDGTNSFQLKLPLTGVPVGDPIGVPGTPVVGASSLVVKASPFLNSKNWIVMPRASNASESRVVTNVSVYPTLNGSRTQISCREGKCRMSSDAVMSGRPACDGDTAPATVIGDCGRDDCVPRSLNGAGDDGRLVTTGD